jgi:hypothetical protein
MNTNDLPTSLQPTAADHAAMAKLDSEREAILGRLHASSGSRVKVNTQSRDSITYGIDGSIIERTINGVSQMNEAQQAVAAAQSAANGEIIRMETDMKRLIDMRDEIKGYKTDGTPDYVRHESDRRQLDKQILKIELGIVNQKRFNEERWRRDAAPTVRRVESDQITATELAKKLMAEGKVQRVSGFI